MKHRLKINIEIIRPGKINYVIIWKNGRRMMVKTESYTCKEFNLVCIMKWKYFLPFRGVKKRKIKEFESFRETQI